MTNGRISNSELSDSIKIILCILLIIILNILLNNRIQLL